MSNSGITNFASQLLVMPVRSPARGDIGPSALDEHWGTTHGWRRRLAISCWVSFPPLHICIALIFLSFMFYSCWGQVSDGLAEFRWLGSVTGCVGGLLRKRGRGWTTWIFCLRYVFLVSGCRRCWYLRRMILCSRNTEGEYNLVCGYDSAGCWSGINLQGVWRSNTEPNARSGSAFAIFPAGSDFCITRGEVVAYRRGVDSWLAHVPTALNYLNSIFCHRFLWLVVSLVALKPCLGALWGALVALK